MKVWTLSTIFLLIVVVVVIIFASAQTTPGSEVTAVYLVDAYEFNGSGSAGCVNNPPLNYYDGDGGYNPSIAGPFLANAVLMVPSYPGGGFTLWNAGGVYACYQSFEFCNPANGRLIETVCGHDIGIPDGTAFITAFPNNLWSGIEPAALLEVNCATYAANHPSLGLQGVCSAGACV